MSEHSVVEPGDHLSAVIERAEPDETRHVQPVAELRPIRAPQVAVSKEDMDWLEARMVALLPTNRSGAVEMLLQTRDEDRPVDISLRRVRAA